MRLRHSVPFLSMALALASSGWLPGKLPAQAQSAQPEPCLTGDPYNLAQLGEVISADTPPSAPVTINEHIIVEYVGTGTMVDSEDEELGLGEEIKGPREPEEPLIREARMDEVPLRIFNTRTKFEFRVQMSNTMLQEMYRCHEQKGLTQAGGPGDFGIIEGQFRVMLPAVHVGKGLPPTAGAELAAAEPMSATGVHVLKTTS